MRQEQEPAGTDVTEVGPGVLRMQLPIQMPGLGHVNMYALQDDRGVAIVDPGLPGPATWKGIQDRFKTAGHQEQRRPHRPGDPQPSRPLRIGRSTGRVRRAPTSSPTPRSACGDRVTPTPMPRTTAPGRPVATTTRILRVTRATGMPTPMR